MKVLVLNSSYQELNFVSFRKAIKYIVNGKVDVISYWPETYILEGKEFNYPATVVLKYYRKKHITESKYNRIGVFNRDDNTCQYCIKKYPRYQLTIDHVVPRHLGGKTNWLNCVTCCHPCNNYKKNMTPKMAGMRLLNEPYIPKYSLWNQYHFMNEKHPDWELYVKK